MRSPRPATAAEETREDPPESREDAYAGAFARLAEQTPELIEQARRRCEAVESLYAELMQAAPDRRVRIVRQARFRRPELLDRLVEESHAQQLSHPALAAHLALLAIRLATVFKEDKAEAVAALPRALCLGANAMRLDFQPATADALLVQASSFLADGVERAFYCRVLGVLRWEQGRTDEAQALLQRAVRLHVWEGLDCEAAVGRTLLGLVLLETGERGDTLSLLARGWAGLERDVQPRLALRGGLALAACLAQADQRERARSVLREAWRLYSQVTDPEEVTRTFWWEGRVLASLGDREEARYLLESVRRMLLEESSPAEAALVSMDLALILAESGQAEEIPPLIASLESVFPAVSTTVLATEGLRMIAEAGPRGHPLHETARAAAVTLRRAFRACRLRIKPFPVV